LYGVASIDVSVNYTDENVIKQKYVNPNVPAIPLTCQLHQARLFSKVCVLAAYLFCYLTGSFDMHPDRLEF